MGRTRKAAQPRKAGALGRTVQDVPAVAVAEDAQRVVTPGDARERVRAAWHAEQGAAAATAVAVRAARAEGVSWHQIGLAVGYTAEGARRRWGPAE